MLNRLLQTLSDITDLSSENREKIRKLYYNDPVNFTEAILTSGIVEEDILLHGIGTVYSIPSVQRIFQTPLSLTESLVEQGFTEHISIHFLKRYCIVPIVRDDTSIFIALNNPCDLSPADDIAAFLNLLEYELVLAPRGEILSAINNLYHQTTESARQLVENMEENGTTIIKAIEETSDLLDDTSDAPVIRLVNHMISQSVKANFSSRPRASPLPGVTPRKRLISGSSVLSIASTFLEVIPYSSA
ncbi:MAG: hypothetical protein HQK67_02940 [Desulfamplus sp.]|nr:hypothetical protein [Desulfamplus sp.]